MSRRIYKFPLQITDIQQISVPIKSQALCVQMQGDFPTLWVIADEEKVKETITVYILGTGHTLPETASILDYLGTVQEREFVWHVFAPDLKGI